MKHNAQWLNEQADTQYVSRLQCAIAYDGKTYLWQLETAIRDLGGKYKCFTLPY